MNEIVLMNDESLQIENSKINKIINKMNKINPKIFSVVSVMDDAEYIF